MSIILLLCICGYTLTNAQEPNDNINTFENEQNGVIIDVDNTLYASPNAVQPKLSADYGEALDSLNLPAINEQGQVISSAFYPRNLNSWNNWNLHRGLNVSLGLSAFASFGKGGYSGAGFAQNISAMYATSLTRNLSLAVGGYFNNMTWGGHTYRDAGLSAAFGYRFNEHWEAYIYAQKSLVNNYNMPRPLYDTNTIRDRIGAAVKYNFNPNFSIQVSVEDYRMPTRQGRYFDQYNYPVPKP